MPETTSRPTTYRLSTKKTSIPANSVSPSSAVRIIRPTATTLKARPRYTVQASRLLLCDQYSQRPDLRRSGKAQSQCVTRRVRSRRAILWPTPCAARIQSTLRRFRRASDG